jgi:hypothetical protein
MMKASEIDEILNRAARERPELDPALLGRISDSIAAELKPVQPLPSTGVLSAVLLAIGAAMGLAGAAIAGFHGLERQSLPQRLSIFALLGLLAWAAAAAFAQAMIPGSRQRLRPGNLALLSVLLLLGLFGLLFDDYRTSAFVSSGVACLSIGLLGAVPTALLGWRFLRRGFAVSTMAAGVAAGTLAGLSGVLLLELHCDNFQALHVLLWHTAVVPISAAAGAAVGWLLGWLRKRA